MCEPLTAFMQLDFFKKLTARLDRAIKVARPPASILPALADAAELEAQARKLFSALGCAALAASVRVRWNPRMRSTAGTAFASKSLVTLNPRLLAFGAEEIDRTLRHELAHLLAQHRAGRRRIAPHGREWERACRDLDIAGEKRCHDLPLPRRQMPARHAYRCPGCRLVVHRVRPMKRKSACLGCCRNFTGGRYDERFRFQRIEPG